MQNDNLTKREREISLVDLCVEILLRWRTIVVVMLIGGVLMGGFGYVRSLQAAKTQLAQLEAKEQQLAEQKEQTSQMTEEELQEWKAQKKQELEEGLKETQIVNVNTAVMYERFSEEKSTYMQESVLMQADPFNVPKAELTFLVKSDDLEKTYNIEKVYEDLLTSTELFNYVRETCGIENEVNNLITLERSAYNQMQGSDTVRISVLHSDEVVCQAMADAIVDYVQNQQKQLNSVVGLHKIELISQSFGTVMDEELLAEQRSCKTDISTLRTTAIKLKDAFTDKEMQYYDLLVAETVSVNQDTEAEKDKNDNTTTANTVASPSISIKYVVLGMILFAFLYVFVIFLMYILNSKLRITDGLQELYGIPQLGTIPEAQKKKKLLGIVDQLILKLRYRNQRRFNTGESVNLASVATKMAVKKQDINKVCLIGCNLTGETLDICEQVKARLTAEGIAVQILSNVLYDAEVMEELTEAQGAVLVETAESTLYDEIAKELELLNRQNITVLGGIVVE